MQNYELMGESRDWLDERDDWKWCFESYEFILGNPHYADGSTLRSFVTECVDVVAYTNLGAAFDPDSVLLCCERGVDQAIEAFYGEWMNREEYFEKRESRDLSIPPVLSRKEEYSWYDGNRCGITLALLIGRDNDAKRIASWAVADLIYDEGLQDYSQGDNDYHVVMSSYVADQPDDRVPKLEEAIRNGRKPRPKLLLATLDAIRQRDAAAYQAGLKDYLKRYVKVELKKSMGIDFLALDAVILWHLADRAGLEHPVLPPMSRAVLTTAVDLNLPVDWSDRVGPTSPLLAPEATTD